MFTIHSCVTPNEKGKRRQANFSKIACPLFIDDSLPDDWQYLMSSEAIDFNK